MQIISVKIAEDGGYAVAHTVQTVLGEQQWVSFVDFDNAEVAAWVEAGNIIEEPEAPKEG